MLKLTLATLAVFAIAAIAIFIVPLPTEAQQKITDPQWVVVFSFKQDNLFDPTARLYVMVAAKAEGEAAIKAHRYLSERIAIAALDKLEYQEAQQKASK